ncbi:MAG: alanine:cation symporter family protein [Gammaproteobacteria bacterium]|nr:alanine:cation symporter family protein [Gammaproteobacteria bacterium]
MLAIKLLIKKLIAFSACLIFFKPAIAQDSSGIDSIINNTIQPLTALVSKLIFFTIPVLGTQLPLVVLWLIIGAIFFTGYFNFINVRGFKHSIRVVRGDYSNPSHPGEVSHFQALATAVSGTVGVGNIGGVAVAISIGGPGATFWMILAGLLGMSTKFVECALGTIYRREHSDGSVSGGPMYYLERGLKEKGLKRLGSFMAKFYAIGIVISCLGIGNMFQSNQAYVQFVNVTGGTNGSWFHDKGWLFGLIIALAVGIVIIGGIKSIARVTEKLVPFMAILYVLSALTIITMNYEALPFAFLAIFNGAFSPEALSGSALGVMIVGFQRAVFSNEAGIGSAAIAHSAVRTTEPITEGYVALLEPFIDTVVICTITALVITTTLYYDPNFVQGLGGIEMTSAAFERNISWSPYVIAISGMLFAFSTMVAWSYYGLKGWTYLVGKSQTADLGFKTVFCLFVMIGCSIQLSAVLDFSDALVFFICIPNILGLYILAPTLKKKLKDYNHRLTTGEIKNYRESSIPD